MLWLNKVGFKGRVKASPSGRLFLANCYPTVAKWPHTVDLTKMHTGNKESCWETEGKKNHHRYRITLGSAVVQLITATCHSALEDLAAIWETVFLFFSLWLLLLKEVEKKTTRQNGFKSLFLIWISYIRYWEYNRPQRIIKDTFSLSSL